MLSFSNLKSFTVNSLPNDIVLRPRFQLELNQPKETALKAFETAEQNSFLVKRVDDHVFIKYKKQQAHFWSPQLHLEINETNQASSKVYGLFGPNPTLWTFFMFLHFSVAVIFIMLGVWAYSNWSIGNSYAFQLAGMVFMVILWFTLYAFGRIGKAKGRPQMNELHQFMKKTLFP